ncbi:Tfp pilus assembly protein, tip-associated adhesin PilY1 [Hydrogenophaga sp. T4]|nr:Tfp pilus assembly protein, tip-associated adhesin PilY1 [Hydrogenophaga sp. T4]
MKRLKLLNTALKVLALGAILSINMAANAVIWPSRPLAASTSATPLTMLLAGKDHKLFYEAYNDASDIDGDGTLDTRFKPEITYYGLYDSTLCYGYSSNRFNPAGNAGALGECKGNWSGNWLNYMTTSRIDALRKVLYGGYRYEDTTSITVLQRAYIPQDAHSWGKEFHSSHGYKISDYTPFDEPTSNDHRHFFGNLTPNRDVNCSTLDNCSDIAPILRVRENVGGNHRIWEWASKERPVLHDSLSTGAFPAGTGNQKNYNVRVEVCSTSNTDYLKGCKKYPNGSYKPTGLLHEYGENESMLFGLMTGSYDQHMSGGRLRKVISSFTDEVDSDTGIFNSTAPIVNSLNNLRIRGFNQNNTSGEYWKSSPYTDSAKAATEGQLLDWGNPIGEILYEATRYIAGKKSATSVFNVSTTRDTQVGLSSATWDDPYDTTSAAKASYCAKASFITISDVYPSYDSDQLPGSSFGSFSGDLTGLDVTTRAGNITGLESNITGMKFIGQSTATNYDSAPTAKNVTSLGTIRGLAPEDPSKQGSYYSAAVAYHAKTTDLRDDLEDKQTIDNYVVALSSPLPKIEVTLPVSKKIITLVPFAKTVAGSGVSSTKGNYQPTNQIVDFYVETIANSGEKDADSGINGGRYKAEFLINFEDVEQGGDHDMDAIARYTVQANADDTLSVTVTPTYQAGGMQQHMGYVISGTNRDGVYLVATDETNSPAYFLNVPPDRSAGYCDSATVPSDCDDLPSIGEAIPTFNFSAGTSGGATLLKDPLWYVAKYGGFVDRNGSNTPDLDLEWDEDDNKIPDTYFQVQNPLKLRESLRKAFDEILEKGGGGGNVTANSTTVETDSLVFQAIYNSARWSGNLEAYPITDDGVGATAKWKASDEVPAPDDRNIFYGSDATGSIGKEFKWASLSTAEKTLLETDEKILNYLRGDRSEEIRNSGMMRDRDLENVLGDITHSSPRFSKDTEVVFVGANDGMLHAFDSGTGAELFAYIPSAMLPQLKLLPKVGYNESHKYFVDGEMVVSTTAQTTGKNYLAATLGRGGKGLFGLDVSDPKNFAAADVLWEYFPTDTDADLVEDDPDLGYMLGRPVIAKMQDGTWAVIVGNGYNSVSGNAVLYVFNLATGTLIKKLDTGADSDNGLASPGVRLDADGEAIAIYAGDLQGNLWEFDVSSASSGSWVVANSGSPFFVAKDSGGKVQPITAPITMKVNEVTADANNGKLFVYFGTGSDFTVDDPNNTDTQTWYGLIDEGSVITARSDLKERTISSPATLAGKSVRVFSEAVAGDMNGKKGFFIDLPVSGERMVTASNYYKLAEPVLIASSIIPSVDDCSPGGSGYLNAINPFTGARLTKPFFDVTNDGDFTNDIYPGDGGGFVGSIDLGVGKPGEAILIGKWLTTGGSKGIIEEVRVNLGLTPFTGRLSWREIVTD